MAHFLLKLQITSTVGLSEEKLPKMNTVEGEVLTMSLLYPLVVLFFGDVFMSSTHFDCPGHSCLKSTTV